MALGTSAQTSVREKKGSRTIWARTRTQACIDASTYSRSAKYTQKYDHKQAETERTNVDPNRSRHRCRRRTFADLRLRQLFDPNSGLWSPWKLPPLEPLEPLEEPLPAAYPHYMVGEVDFVLSAHAAYICHVHLPTRTLTVSRASVSGQVQAAIYARWREL